VKAIAKGWFALCIPKREILLNMTTKHCIVAAILVGSVSLFAQPYSVDWHKVAGGGGASTGAVYQVSGTIGQSDAGGVEPMVCGLRGGVMRLSLIYSIPGMARLLPSRA